MLVYLQLDSNETLRLHANAGFKHTQMLVDKFVVEYKTQTRPLTEMCATRTNIAHKRNF